MSISSVKTGAVGVSLLAGNTAYDPAATFLIARANGTGSSGTITFSAIPATFQHLQIRWIGRSDNASNDIGIDLRFNSDTGSNYARHWLNGDGSTASASGAASQSLVNVGRAAGANQTSGIISSGIIDIQDYTSTTKNKTIRSFAGQDFNGSGTIRLNSGLWMNTNAVTSISLIANAGNWTTASTFALYGMVG